MNILDRHRIKLEKNKELNKAMRKRAFERYLIKIKRRKKKEYLVFKTTS